MQFFIIVIIFSFVLFLYKLYHLANDDHILIKKNIPLKDIFNCAIVVFLLSLLAARVFYVIANPQPAFLNPLGFLAFPYFPGLSLTGGLLSGVLILFIYSKIKKFPTARIFDFFAMAFVFVLPIGWLGFMILSSTFSIGALVILMLYILMYLGFNYYLYPKSTNLELNDGTKSILFLIFFSLIFLLGTAIDNPGINTFITNKENIVLLAVLVLSTIMLAKHESKFNFSYKKNGKKS